MDSRDAFAGCLFVALPGTPTDSHRYIPQAIQQGAVAVMGTQPYQAYSLSVPYIQVRDARFALAYLSAALYNFPARSMTMIGVTGTDGKTTTTNLIYHILLAAGLKAGMISTVNAVIGDQVLDTGFHVTTPEAPDVQRYLALMREAGLTHAVLEATSHGLAQDRVTACEFDIAVVTNITHEHLDYHGSYEAYRAAKARLFQFLETTVPKPQGNPRLAVLNRDDASYSYLSALVKGPQVDYSLQPGAQVWAESVHQNAEGLSFVAHVGQHIIPIRSRLIGEYNVSNILAALAATVLGLSVAPEAAQLGVSNLPGIPGRMERIDLGQDFLAIVDFAHTPNALKRALTTVRQLTSGRVIAIFGSAGLRDREKRHLMAAESARLADITILTAEDPRTESLTEILEVMLRAAVREGAVEGQTVFRVPDRGEAMRLGVRLAQPGDVVIALGKGCLLYTSP
ncbi:MAG: UDP-N-acetylmuramoyl-L-alanyl-D-glutamate--2,6-diaminopimelate ligase, partial [Thermanaerothrix sp.]|nr:UDP-N-acetylmuramoyl-L-alanyl-D-glutamate--2,6-diaminopimelate ligase [Thermanaerothrix sp.]